MNLGFDTSFLAPLILQEATSETVEAFIAALSPEQLCISQWTRVEFASLIAREVRMGSFTQGEALTAIVQFDDMVEKSWRVLVPRSGDYELAKNYVQRFETKLRAGDALHLAIAHNHGASVLYTLDEGLLKAAELVKVSASRGIQS